MFFQNKKGKKSALADAFPVYSYEDNKVIYKDGRVAIGYRVNAAEMELWGPEAFAAAWAGFQQALKNLPVGCVVQKADVFYDRPYVHPPTPGQYFAQRMGDYFQDRLVLYCDSYLFLSFAPAPLNSAAKTKPPRPTTALNALINRAEEALPPTVFDSIALTLSEAERYASEFVEAMRSLPNVGLERMDEQQIRQLYLQYMNLDFDSFPQQFEREILNEVGTLAVGEQKLNVVSLTGQGTEVHTCVRNGYGVISPMVYPLTNFLKIPHIFTQAIQIQDTKEVLKDMDQDVKFNTGLSRFATQDNAIRIMEVSEFAAEVRSAGKELCLLHLSILVWEASDQMRKKNLEVASAAMRTMFASEAVIESFNTLPMYLGCLPGNGFQIPDRWIPTSADRATCFFHWTQSYRSTKTGEYICDRFRNLKRVNLFDISQDNQNSLTIGPSGSGKSYTMGNFIIQRFENKARQIIIDVGGSYKNVCKSLTGNDFENCYFEYDPTNPIEFNPFFIPREPESNQWLYQDEKVTFHLSLIGTLWKASGALDRPETVIFARYLKNYYLFLNSQQTIGHADEEYPGMDSFFNYVLRTHQLLMLSADKLSATQREDIDLLGRREQYNRDIKYVQMDEFFLVVRDYTLTGRYAKVLNARRDVDLSEYPLIAFDMARVKLDPTLYPVVAMLITELSLDLFRRFPNEVKYIIMDEAWSMLSGALQDFIENMYRTIRKTKGSIGIITQGVLEIENSAIGLTLVDNSATKIILLHENETTRERLRNVLGFTDQDMALISSMRKEPGCREFLIKQGTRATVFALEASPQLNAICSSGADERAFLNKLILRYQRKKPVALVDSRGLTVLDPITRLPMYSTIYEQRLELAVDAFVEAKGTDPELQPAR